MDKYQLSYSAKVQITSFITECEQPLNFCIENLEEYIKEENAFIENTINSLPHDVFFNSEVLEQIKGIRYVQQDNFEGTYKALWQVDIMRNLGKTSPYTLVVLCRIKKKF